MKRFLIPAFLQRFDRYLLNRYPIIWETKLHYVLFYSGIVANGLLCAIGFLIPVSKKNFPDYADFMFPIVGWGLVLAFLALVYYTYQQSFVRIRVYAMKENILRYGLYIIAVTSILANVLTLPHTVRYRVVGLFEAGEFKKDFEDLYRWKYLNDLTKYMMYDEDFNGRLMEPKKIVNKQGKIIEIDFNKYEWVYYGNTYLLNILHKSPINQAQETKQLAMTWRKLEEIVNQKNINKPLKNEYEITHFTKKLKKVVDATGMEINGEVLSSFLENPNKFLAYDPTLKKDLDLLMLKPDSIRIANTIQHYSNWHPIVKRHLINQLSLVEILNISLNNLEESKLLFEIPIPAAIHLIKKYAQYPSDENFEHLHYSLHRLMPYHSASVFLLDRDYDSYQIEGFFSKRHHIFENIKENTSSNTLEVSKLEDVQRIIDDLSNKARLQKEIDTLYKENFIQYHYFSESYSIFILFLSLLILTIKTYTLRNVFISALGMLASLFLTVALLYHQGTYLSEWRDSLLNQFYYVSADNISKGEGLQHHHLFLPWVVPFMIMFTFGLFALRVWIGNLNRKWLQTFWVFMTASALTISAYTFLGLLSAKYTESMDYHLAIQVSYLYPLFALFVLGMYLFYNRMLILPQKK